MSVSEFSTYFQFGLRHILDVAALDHLLFLVALAAIYQYREWRPVLWVVSAFTVGHSLTLALAVTGVVSLPMALIEFLIPVTIVATCVETIVARDRTAVVHRRSRPLIAGVFGLIHGAGFANYLKSLFLDDVAVPILAFNVGIEVAQVIVLAAAFAMFVLVDGGFQRARNVTAERAVRLRAIAVSLVGGVVAAWWAVQRVPA